MDNLMAGQAANLRAQMSSQKPTKKKAPESDDD